MDDLNNAEETGRVDFLEGSPGTPPGAENFVARPPQITENPNTLGGSIPEDGTSRQPHKPIANNKHVPQFLRGFSKEQSAEERSEVAQQIRAKRSEYFTRKGELPQTQQELSERSNELQTQMTERAEKLAQVTAAVAELSDGWFSKTLHLRQLRKAKTEQSNLRKMGRDLERQQWDVDFDEKNVAEKLKQKGVDVELGEARRLLGSFYDEEEVKWANTPYGKEDIKKYFAEDHLVSLSLEDYKLLLRRFPNHMVTHVTRQGVRDHAELYTHSAGLWEFQNNFVKILQDGHLQSSLGPYLREGTQREAIAEFLGLSEAKTKEEALVDIDKQTSEIGDSGGMADKLAIHMATDEVADWAYGSEAGNEIFFAFPSAYIANEHYFRGQLNKASGGGWNDQWVYPNDDKGININAGIVFIPSNAAVDRRTGSQYSLDLEGKVQERGNYIAIVQQLTADESFYKLTKQYIQDMDRQNSLAEGENIRELYEKELHSLFNVTDTQLLHALSNPISVRREPAKLVYAYEQVHGLQERNDTYFDNGGVDRTIKDFLKEAKLLYKKADNPVSSRQYWERYFQEHPQARPNKIFWYANSDPTRALEGWRSGNKIEKTSDSMTMGFPEHANTSPQVTLWSQRFNALAKDVIDEYFTSKALSPAGSAAA